MTYFMGKTYKGSILLEWLNRVCLSEQLIPFIIKMQSSTVDCRVPGEEGNVVCIQVVRQWAIPYQAKSRS